MKLPVSQIHEGDNALHFDSRQDGWVRDVMHHVEKRGYRFNSPMLAEMNLVKLEPDYYLRGRLEFAIQQTCARCAEPFQLDIKHPFEVAFAHISGQTVRKTAKLTEESEELDINFFEGPELDLAPVVEEQFFLSIPYQAVCKPACRGMCQKCGQNLNAGACGCSGEIKPNPFSILKQLKTQD